MAFRQNPDGSAVQRTSTNNQSTYRTRDSQKQHDALTRQARVGGFMTKGDAAHRETLAFAAQANANRQARRESRQARAYTQLQRNYSEGKGMVGAWAGIG